LRAIAQELLRLISGLIVTFTQSGEHGDRRLVVPAQQSGDAQQAERPEKCYGHQHQANDKFEPCHVSLFSRAITCPSKLADDRFVGIGSGASRVTSLISNSAMAHGWDEDGTAGQLS
jgi:hypothetical protein